MKISNIIAVLEQWTPLVYAEDLTMLAFGWQ